MTVVLNKLGIAPGVIVTEWLWGKAADALEVDP